MVPAAVYPISPSAQVALVILALVATVALPPYLLLLRPLNRRGIWGLGEIVGVSLLFVPLYLLLAVTIGAVEVDGPLSVVPFSILTIAQNAAFVGLSAYVVLVRYRLSPKNLGLRFDGWPRKVVTGILGAAVTVPLAIAAERLAIFLMGFVMGPEAAAARAVQEQLRDPLRGMLQSITDLASARWILLLLVVVVPLGEEVFFRGLVYGGLRSRWGVMVGALASAAFFSAVHAQVVHALPIFVLGVFLAVLYERTGSLLPGIVTHGLNNVIAVLSIWRDWGF